MRSYPKYFFLLLAACGFASTFAADTPYAGQQNRTIKALSDQEIADYAEGRGMGTAKAAELNHYPGPAHVLAESARLELSDRQKKLTQSIFDTMSTQAKRTGAAIVAKEADLDDLYASGHATPSTLRDLLVELSRLQTEFRYAHLSAHLAMRAVLTPTQIARYDEMRGYMDLGAKSRHSAEGTSRDQHTHH